MLLYNQMKIPIESLKFVDEIEELTSNLKIKIFDILDIGEMKDKYFYRKTLEILKSIIDVDKNEKIAYKFLDSICLYIKYKIISENKSESTKLKAFDFFINSVSKYGELYEKFISCFQIKEELLKYLEKKENLLNFKINSIFLIKLFNLQNILSLKEYILLIKNNTLDFPLINALFHTYNRTEEELLNLYQFIVSKITKYSITFEEMEKLFDNNCIKEEIKKSLRENYLKPPIFSDKYYSLYYQFIYKNNLDKLENVENFLCDLIFNFKFYDTSLTIIKCLNEEKIKSLDKSLLKQLLYVIKCEDIDSNKFLLEYLPEELNNIVNKYLNYGNKTDLMKLLQKVNIKDKSKNKIIQDMEETNINNFYLWKIRTHFYDELNILLEFIKSQKEFDIFIKLISEIIYNNSNGKLSYILKYAKIKGFILPEIKNENWNLLVKEAEEKIDNEINFPKDEFGPKTEGCISYSKNDIKIIFIQNCDDLAKNFELYFNNSKYIGIDTEWIDSLLFDVKTKTAIMQLCDYDGKNILILDMIELIKDKNFEDTFENLFFKKIFISFGFKNDYETLPDNLMIFFKEKAKIIDIRHLYEIKYFENCPSISKLCQNFFGKPLCKYEQCSDWERRPLRESQLHYAVLDSIFCCLIFKKLIG